MDLENIVIQMERNILENGKKMHLMEQENILKRIRSILGILLIVKKMEKELK